MCNFFFSLNPIFQALIASCFTFSITSSGAAIVFFFKKVNKDIMDSMLSISSGIMLSAAFFSLLLPAINSINKNNYLSIILILLSFIMGGFLLYIGNIIINHFNKYANEQFSIKRCIMLFTSITLHNIPEGLVIGVAFGSVALSKSSIISAITLSIAIGLQNFPEGCAISLPLRREGLSRSKSFFIAVISGIVEPISAVIGSLLILKVNSLLPFILVFAAGAMIYVIIIDLIPESQKNNKQDYMALLTMFGFLLMMLLEIIL